LQAAKARRRLVGKNLRRASFRGAHAPSRVAFGALAKGIFVTDRVGSAKKFASARAPTPTREGACAPRVPAPERPVFPVGSLAACEGSHSTPGGAVLLFNFLEADGPVQDAVSSENTKKKNCARPASRDPSQAQDDSVRGAVLALETG